MTGGQFSEVDLDLLADYVGGALAGTREAAEVGRLVGADPAWAEAHAALTAGVDAVRVGLASWAAEPAPPMPPEIVDRLASAITGAAPPGPVGATRAGTDSGDEHSGRRPAVVPAQGGAPRPGRAGSPGRRRWSRLAGPVAIAAAVAAVGGFGVAQLLGTAERGDNAATSQGAAEDSAARGPAFASGPPRVLLEPSDERVLASGTDYTPATVPEAVRATSTRPAPLNRASQASKGGDNSGPQVLAGVGDLARLADPTALAGCLDAVAAAHNQGPVVVDLVDYASFQGSAALVVVFTDQAQARWVWVTGPRCGTPGTGADGRYQTRVR